MGIKLVRWFTTQTFVWIRYQNVRIWWIFREFEWGAIVVDWMCLQVFLNDSLLVFLGCLDDESVCALYLFRPVGLREGFVCALLVLFLRRNID